MVAVVTDDMGSVLVEKTEEGGSNNIAELLAVKEALMWCVARGVKEAKIVTDSRNNLSWIMGKRVGKKINDRSKVVYLKSAIEALRQSVDLDLVWRPREGNKAGEYIERKYAL